MVRVYRSDLGYGQGTDGQNYYDVSPERALELEAAGYSTNPSDADAGRSAPGGSIYTGTDTADAYAESSSGTSTSGYQKGLEKANALYSFLPPALLDTFAQSWAKYGDANIAMGATKLGKVWRRKHSYGCST